MGFYATELARMIVEYLGVEHRLALFSILAAGLLSMVATLLVLRPWKHTRANSRE